MRDQRGSLPQFRSRSRLIAGVGISIAGCTAAVLVLGLTGEHKPSEADAESQQTPTSTTMVPSNVEVSREPYRLTSAEEATILSTATNDPEVRELVSASRGIPGKVVPWGTDAVALGGLVTYELEQPAVLPVGTRKVVIDPASNGYTVTSSTRAVTGVRRLLVLVAFDRNTVVSIESGPGGHVEGPRQPSSTSED